MRIDLKGIHPSTATLADGTRKTYWYAWKGKGAPRLRGEPGSPEFIASCKEAVAVKIAAPEGRLLRLLQEYQRSQAFLGLRERTREDYVLQIKKIEIKFGEMPIKALADRRARGVFKDWRDELALKSPRQADYAWTVLAAVLAWAKDRGKITANPCERGGRVYHGTRVDKVWSIEDEEAFLKSASAHLHLPLLLALWTGQRQGDLLRLPWSAYDGKVIRLRQSKSMRKGGRRPVNVTIPVGAPLKEALDAAARRKRSTVILTTMEGTPWTSDGFRASWGKAIKKAGVIGVTFNDLRGTAVTRLALVGCTEAEIAAITGHSLRDVRSILDAHYLHRDPELARKAIHKLEMDYAQRSQRPEPEQTLQNDRQNGLDVLPGTEEKAL
jgi:integrase